MGVKSARVQEIIQGDAVSLVHTLVRPAAIGPNEGYEYIPISMGDVVKAVYQTTQPTDDSLPAVDPIEVTGTVDPNDAHVYHFAMVAADSAKLLSGRGQTVRLEITRSGGGKESHYLYSELDVLARAWPAEAKPIIELP